MSTSQFCFPHPTTVIIAGPTKSGKTFFVMRCLRHHIITPSPERIIWCYKEWQENYDLIKADIPSIEFVSGIDEKVLDSVRKTERNLIILDDLMRGGGKSKLLASMFTEESHHKNLTVIFIVQNIFNQGKEMRNISLNAHFLVLYKNPRDKTQIRTLGYQIFPDDPKFLVSTFEHATQIPHSYLVVDLHPETKEEFRLVTNIFPGEIIRFYNQSKV